MLTVEEARTRILDKIHVLGTEKVPLLSASGRVLAEDIIAPHNVPPHPNSAMDGYAVRAEDSASASPAHRVELAVVEDLPAGYVSQSIVQTGQAIRIMTGAPIPEGTNAVIRVEDTERAGEHAVRIFKAVPPGYDIRPAGEDLRQGAVVLSAGRILRPADIGLLASLGKAFAPVYQCPQVAILSTGDEVLDLDEPLRPGKIYNANSYTLAALALEAGAIPIQLGIARDTRADLLAKFAAGVRADLILSSGGVSVGDYDFVKEILTQPDASMEFWSICMKPGKPLAFGNIQGTPTFGLPGNPVSVMVSFEMFVRPALLKMMGHTNLNRPVVHATMQNDYRKHDERRHYLRVALTQIEGKYQATLTGGQGSGILSSMAKANGLAVIAEDRMAVQAGENVPVILL